MVNLHQVIVDGLWRPDDFYILKMCIRDRVYTGAAIALVNWVYKNYMLVVRGVDLLPLWPR